MISKTERSLAIFLNKYFIINGQYTTQWFDTFWTKKKKLSDNYNLKGTAHFDNVSGTDLNLQI